MQHLMFFTTQNRWLRLNHIIMVKKSYRFRRLEAPSHLTFHLSVGLGALFIPLNLKSSLILSCLIKLIISYLFPMCFQ